MHHVFVSGGISSGIVLRRWRSGTARDWCALVLSLSNLGNVGMKSNNNTIVNRDVGGTLETLFDVLHGAQIVGQLS